MRALRRLSDACKHISYKVRALSDACSVVLTDASSSTMLLCVYYRIVLDTVVFLIYACALGGLCV